MERKRAMCAMMFGRMFGFGGLEFGRDFGYELGFGRGFEFNSEFSFFGFRSV